MHQAAELVLKEKIVVIIRRVYGSQLEDLVGALFEGGMRLVEVTFDQADPECEARTAGALEALTRLFGGRMAIGAGTVLTPEQADVAHGAGARFIVSPNVDADVILRTKALGMASVPGAMTPSEILTAHKLGADLVKVFPAGDLGLAWFKSIRAPITHVRMLATGGVTEDNFADYLAAGYAGAGISGRLTEKALLDRGGFAEFTLRARAFRDIAARHAAKG